MARYFREQDIDEYRECFYLYARSGSIQSVDQLTLIMRSLGMCPTMVEVKEYMSSKSGRIAFSDFLEIVHTHSKKEDVPAELMRAFNNYDTAKRGMIPAKDLWNILVKWGEKLTPREVDHMFREANVNPNGMVRYEEFVNIVCS